MKKACLCLVIFLLTLPCKGQLLGKEAINLEKFVFDFDIPFFYSEELKK